MSPVGKPASPSAGIFGTPPAVLLVVLDLVAGALAVVVVLDAVLLVDTGAPVVLANGWPLVLADFLWLVVDFLWLAVEFSWLVVDSWWLVVNVEGSAVVAVDSLPPELVAGASLLWPLAVVTGVFAVVALGLRLDFPEGFVIVWLLLPVAGALAVVLLCLLLELVVDASAGLEVVCSFLLVPGATEVVLGLLLEFAEGV